MFTTIFSYILKACCVQAALIHVSSVSDVLFLAISYAYLVNILNSPHLQV